MYSRRQKTAQTEQLQFLGGFLAGAQHAQVVQLAPDGRLANVLRVSEKGEMALAQERGHHATTSSTSSHGENHRSPTRQAHGGNDLLDQPADGLNHRDAVRGLHPRALQPVVEARVFVGGQVQPRGVLHHLDADVAGEAIGQQRIEIADGAAEMPPSAASANSARHQPPEVGRQRTVRRNASARHPE